MAGVIEDFTRCYAAIRSRDARFDGWFVLGVTSTGIYCRPSCPARTPKPANVRLYATAAGAQGAGFRACRRCRPDTTPGSPEWDLRADVVGRAMRLIADGVVDREGVPGLAARLGYSARHVHRQLVAEVGAGPLALARSQRAHTARILIETTALPFARVAFAAGFASVRQFNDTVRAVFAAAPSDLRAAARRAGRPVPGVAERLVLRLAHREPYDVAAIWHHLAAHAVPGVEVVGDGVLRRSLVLPHGPAVVALEPAAGHVRATLHLNDLRDLTVAVRRCRRLLDLDADPVAVDAHLVADDRLAPLVAARPGVRVAAGVDPAEAALRIVLGQQVSIAAARTLAGRLVGLAGTSLAAPLVTLAGLPDVASPAGLADAADNAPTAAPRDAVTHRFPSAAAVAEADLDRLGMPGARRRTLRSLATALAEGSLDLGPGADREAARAALQALPGIGPWTVEAIAMRALADPDALPVTDLVLRRSAEALGLAPGSLASRAEAWRPWRAYAAAHLWAHATGTGPAVLPPARGPGRSSTTPDVAVRRDTTAAQHPTRSGRGPAHRTTSPRPPRASEPA